LQPEKSSSYKHSTCRPSASITCSTRSHRRGLHWNWKSQVRSQDTNFTNTQILPTSYVIHPPFPAPVSSPIPPQQPYPSQQKPPPSFNRRHKQLLSTPLSFLPQTVSSTRKKKQRLIHLQNSHLWRPVGDIHALEM
jgi:hypothetical protein